MISGNNNIPHTYDMEVEKDHTSSILEDAVRVTSGPRRRDYDSPTPNHARIARLWNAYIESRKTDLGAPLSALDISHMMILLKLARAVYTPTRDSYVDMAGYAQCAAQIAGFDPEACPEPSIQKA